MSARAFSCLCLVIFALTFGLYVKTVHYDFVAYDDQAYVYGNLTTNGLNAATIKWAFTDSYKTLDNWHPLTVLSLLADVEMFGVSPGAMHLHNAVLHAVNAVLLFYFLLLLLGYMEERGQEAEKVKWKVENENSFLTFNFSLFTYLGAFIGAAFWAWHPLRVESVAWISSRKDVLCVFWYLLGHLAYLKWNKGERGFLLAIPAFLFAFMSKPTAIVFPGTLFLMDYLVSGKIRWTRITIFAVATCFFAALVIISQEYAISECYPILTRLLNAVASMGDFLVATVCPTKLCPFYPYEAPVSLTRLIPGLILLSALGGVVAPFLLRFIKDIKRSFLCDVEISTASEARMHADNLVSMGLLWFFVSLLPVIGIIHVGFASHADRYTYLSGIGLSIVLSFLVLSVLKKGSQQGRWCSLALFGTIIALYAYVSSAQIHLWKDSIALFTHTLKHTQDNFIAHCVVSSVHCRAQRLGPAFEHARLSMAKYDREDLHPAERMEACLFLLFKEEGRGVNTFEDLVGVQVKDDELFAAEKLYAQAVLAYKRELSSAEYFIKDSLRLKPEDGYSWEFYARILLSQDRKEEAREALKRAHELLPNRGSILKRMRRI